MTSVAAVAAACTASLAVATVAFEVAAVAAAAASGSSGLAAVAAKAAAMSAAMTLAGLSVQGVSCSGRAAAAACGISLGPYMASLRRVGRAADPAVGPAADSGWTETLLQVGVQLARAHMQQLTHLLGPGRCSCSHCLLGLLHCAHSMSTASGAYKGVLWVQAGF